MWLVSEKAQEEAQFAAMEISFGGGAIVSSFPQFSVYFQLASSSLT